MNDGVKWFGIIGLIIIVMVSGGVLWLHQAPSKAKANSDLLQINENLDSSLKKLRLMRKYDDTIFVLAFTGSSVRLCADGVLEIPKLTEGDRDRINRLELPFWAQNLDYYGVISYTALAGGQVEGSDAIASIFQSVVVLGYEKGRWRFCYALQRMSAGSGDVHTSFEDETFLDLDFISGEFVGKAIEEFYVEP